MFRRIIQRTGTTPVLAARAPLAAAAALPPAVLSPDTAPVRADDDGAAHTGSRGVAALPSCTTSSDGWTGRADCSDPTGQVIPFRVVVCGWWPDRDGHRGTPAPVGRAPPPHPRRKHWCNQRELGRGLTLQRRPSDLLSRRSCRVGRPATPAQHPNRSPPLQH